MMNSLFVTGIDTEVGKTRISVALIALLQQQGHKVAAMKPIASGCELTAEGLRNDDALQLQQQADVNLPYELVNPYAFEPAIAPHIAAKQAGIEIDLDLIKHHFDVIKNQAESVIVEGAGGWLVPINNHATMADVAIQLGLPVVLVIGIRLGCINHALLSVQAIEQSGLPLHGWVANNIESNTESSEIVNTLKHRISAPCLGIVPFLSAGEKATAYLKLETKND